MRELCSDPEIVKLLDASDEEYPEDVIPYNCSFPHEYIPETITKTERFINFEISAVLDDRNNVFKDLAIYFFIVCHQDVVRYMCDGREFLWYDKAVCELDRLFGNTNILGVGETILVSNKPYCPQQKFKGRLLKFAVKDFNNGLKYGK